MMWWVGVSFEPTYAKKKSFVKKSFYSKVNLFFKNIFFCTIWRNKTRTIGVVITFWTRAWLILKEIWYLTVITKFDFLIEWIVAYIIVKKNWTDWSLHGSLHIPYAFIHTMYFSKGEDTVHLTWKELLIFLLLKIWEETNFLFCMFVYFMFVVHLSFLSNLWKLKKN
jgi:hypothetical protein